MKAKPLIIGGLAAAGLAALLAWGFRPDPVPVDLAEVTRGEMLLTINADGKTRIRDVYEVASPIGGQAQRSPVSVGDRVIAGKTVVAVVQPVAPTLLDARSRASAEAAVAEAEAALRVAKSRVNQAEEELNHAAAEYARTATLVDRGVETRARLEDASEMRALKEAAVEVARSSQAMAEGALARARAALIGPDPETPADAACCVELHAPTDGVVLSVASMSERPVATGARLLTVGRPDDLEIVADLLSADAVRLAPGSRAIVERWGGDHTLEAVLRKIEPSARTKVSALGIEEQRVDVLFDLLSGPEMRPGLGDGFAVFLRIVEWRGQDVIQAPLSALFRHDGGWHVFRAEEGLARRVPVEVGRRNSHVAQILSGLAPGERVVTHPSDLVEDGVDIVDRAELE
ncbi:efflux RND transporter periplasmic adaptor subunit [Aestuariicoccus sp. MJ-SS9]|uniref:efflux RND transporter periplasmic adaptor subunit n=1 Tax=Aestuariicoccus sp. MJ-SS9 TaxID=3079855 RepID=UPI00290838FC|nr:HlyD family efflux transporter periplasmic adaptor subunit [Aestuariicoccus sp. MJ-SS9]MDU8913677.1 HlyD family efflux transporter periplasmic adaptor subunit [Aestuariicoccus sp. MJ-SS9]